MLATLNSQSSAFQALFQKEVEKAALSEEIATLRQDLATAGMEMERKQREALSKQEQDKVKMFQGWTDGSTVFGCKVTDLCLRLFQNAILVLRSELQGLQHQFEESLKSYQSSKNSLMEEVRELTRQREQDKREVEMLQFFLSVFHTQALCSLL